MAPSIPPSLLASLDEAEAHGRLVTRSAPAETRRLSRLVGDGRLVSPHPGLFARTGYWDCLSPSEQNMALARSLAGLHPGWTFSHQTAALFYGLSVSYACLGRVHYTTLSRGGSKDSGLTSHHQARGVEWRMVDGIRVSPPERMAYDCARTLGFSDGLVILDGALRSGLLTREKLERCLRQHSGGRGIRRARHVFDVADGRAESGAESVARATILSLGVPIHDLQLVVDDLERPGRTYRLDIVLRRADGVLVDVEVDGRQKYEQLAESQGTDAVAVMMRERQREAAITAHGILVARVSARDAGNRIVMERKLRAYGIIP